MGAKTRLSLMFGTIGALLLAIAASGEVQAQPGKGGKKGGGGPAETVDSFIDRIMAFNKAKDGKLTKEELTDPRLHALFDRADTNKDGVVTREELKALYERETAAFGQGGGFGKGDFGDKGKVPGGRGDFGDKKGPKGFGKGMSPLGMVLPLFVQDVLELSNAQRKQVAELQKEVDARLEKILTAEQRQQLRDMRERGPGGFGPPDKKGPLDKKGPPPDKQP
jgi:hypothetical protein